MSNRPFDWRLVQERVWNTDFRKLSERTACSAVLDIFLAAKLHGVSADYLLGLTDEKKPLTYDYSFKAQPCRYDESHEATVATLLGELGLVSDGYRKPHKVVRDTIVPAIRALLVEQDSEDSNEDVDEVLDETSKRILSARKHAYQWALVLHQVNDADLEDAHARAIEFVREVFNAKCREGE